MARPFGLGLKRGPEKMTSKGYSATQQLMTDVGTLVFDTIGELFHEGETTLDPDSVEAIELRKTAYSAVGVKTGGDPLLVSGRELGYSVLEWLQGLGDYAAVHAASQAYESARIKA